jgi:DnaK suppressor protein
MDPATLDIYRQRLLAQRQQMVKRIFDLEDDLQIIGEAEREIERTDRVQAEASEEVLEQLDEQSRREVEAIDLALARIEAGTYGDCDVCGKAINLARLDALPMARRCTSCQALAERATKE